jgi:putative peptidoglycan lipid II flippase
MMGVAIWAAAQVMAPLLVVPGTRVLALIGVLAVGAVSYGLAGRITGAFTLGELRRMMRS